MKKIVFFYWAFILLLQVILIYQKINNYDFYLWNIVALISAIIFIFIRIKNKNLFVNYEILMTCFIGINGITTVLAQFINYNNTLTLIVSSFVGVFSFFIAYKIWKIDEKTAN